MRAVKGIIGALLRGTKTAPLAPVSLEIISSALVHIAGVRATPARALSIPLRFRILALNIITLKTGLLTKKAVKSNQPCRLPAPEYLTLKKIAIFVN
jgi:hypothetical protein